MRPLQSIDVWWHGIAALPADRQDHGYFALRRVWGDHTMAGARGFYQVRSEDHLTPALFENWAMFDDFSWVGELVRFCGGVVGTVTKVRWAYACEELLDDRLRQFHKRNFVIADIMLIWKDEHGIGLVTVEVKRPGVAANSDDSRKLETYANLPSTLSIARRYGCFLVGSQHGEKSAAASGGKWPIVTWDQLAVLQIEAVYRTALPADAKDVIAQWVKRAFARYGILTEARTEAPPPAAACYGTEAGYRAIDNQNLPDRMRRFLKGSECVEAVWVGHQPTPPLLWLSAEPLANQIALHRWQTTTDRRLCRWTFDWNAVQESSWPLSNNPMKL